MMLDEKTALYDQACDQAEFWETTESWPDGEFDDIARDLGLPNDRMPWAPPDATR